ncbi:hypothetical protein A7X67_00440 [Clostridium sp. W14A]|nr:hypothetical protein A7X67_00440 [Clostridium sp. W14A]
MSNSKTANSKPPEQDEADCPGTGPEESKLVPPDGEEYEEQQTGIELSYSLREEEIYECLKRSSYLHMNRKTSVLVLAALAVLAVAFLAVGIATYRSLFYFYAASCATLIIVLGVFPYQNNKARARSSADGHTVRMAVYPDHIQVGRGIKRWEIPMDGTAEFAQIENMLVLYVAEKDDPKRKIGQKMVIIPTRCIKPRNLPDVQAMIVAGTKPKKMPKS